MNYPDYIPANVKKRIECRLDGIELDEEVESDTLTEGDQINVIFSSSRLKGGIKELVGTNESVGYQGSIEQLHSIDEEIEKAVKYQNFFIEKNDPWYIETIRCRITELKNTRVSLAADIDCWNRLVNNPAMEKAFKWFAAMEVTDEQMFHILSAAVEANKDYGEARHSQNKAKEYVNDVVIAACSLQNALNRLNQESAESVPVELTSVRALLDSSVNPRDILWRIEKKNLLNSIDNTYALFVAPSPSDLIGVIKEKASQFEPSLLGMSGAAISSRKSNHKSEFMRAFVYQLSECGVELTLKLVKPLAITLNVALNSASVDVTNDDLRKVFIKASR